MIEGLNRIIIIGLRSSMPDGGENLSFNNNFVN